MIAPVMRSSPPGLKQALKRCRLATRTHSAHRSLKIGLGLIYAGRGLSIRRTSHDCAKWLIGLVSFSRQWGAGVGFILITELDGMRYAVRPQSIGIIHDADKCRDETLVQRRPGPVSARRGARLVHLTIGSLRRALCDDWSN